MARRFALRTDAPPKHAPRRAHCGSARSALKQRRGTHSALAPYSAQPPAAAQPACRALAAAAPLGAALGCSAPRNQRCLSQRDALHLVAAQHAALALRLRGAALGARWQEQLAAAGKKERG